MLSLLKARVLLDQLLLAEAGEADGELGGVAGAFAPEDEAASILGVSDVRAGREAATGR